MAVVSGYEESGRRAQRVRPSGPAAIVGRGRALMLAMMLFLAAVAALASHRGRPGADSARTDLVGSDVAPSSDVRPMAGDATFPNSPMWVSTIWPVNRKNELLSRHGGLLLDQRAELLRSIGATLVDQLEPRDRFGIRFELLADPDRPTSYLFQDGTVAITLGLARFAEVESEVAALLADHVERLLRYRDGKWPQENWGAPSRQMVQSARFDARAISVVQQRLRESNVVLR